MPIWLRHISLVLLLFVGVSDFYGADKSEVRRIDLADRGSDGWLQWSQYSKRVVDGEEFAVVGDKLFSRTAVENMVPSGLGGTGIPPSVIDDVITNGDDIVINSGSRYNQGNVFVWLDDRNNIVRRIRVNKVNSISELKNAPHNIFGYLDTELESLLRQDGWIKGDYGGTSNAVIYFKESRAGRSEIIFNYGGGIHSGGQQFKKPYYYKLEGPEFGRKTRIIDKKTYPIDQFNKAINIETFKVVDGPTGEIWKQ